MKQQVDAKLAGAMRAWVHDQSDDPAYQAAAKTLTDGQLAAVVEAFHNDGVQGFIDWEAGRTERLRKMAEWEYATRID